MNLAVLSAQPATLTETLTIFFGYALLAVFAQNAIFTRALGVSRLVQLVGDERTNSLLFGLLQCVTQLLLAPVAWYVGGAAASLGVGPAARPLVYLGCIAAVSAVEMAFLHMVRLPWQRQLLRILPLAALNSCVLGTLLLGRTQSFTLRPGQRGGLPDGRPAGDRGAEPAAQSGHSRGVPRDAHHPGLHRGAGAGDLWLYRAHRDPVTEYGR